MDLHEPPAIPSRTHRRVALALALTMSGCFTNPGSDPEEDDDPAPDASTSTGTLPHDSTGPGASSAAGTSGSEEECASSGDVEASSEGSSGDAAGESSSGDDDDPVLNTTGGETDGEPGCGNGIVEMGEECDDANVDDTDDCLTSCVMASCGDGAVLAGVEACDDGNDSDADACLTDCTPAQCGDGTIWAGEEECDDANTDDNDACKNDCMLNVCGDGVLGPGEQCDNGAENDDSAACTATCAVAACGDGLVWSGFEDCDDANLVDYDGCSGECVDEPLCGVLDHTIAGPCPATPTPTPYCVQDDGNYHQAAAQAACEVCAGQPCTAYELCGDPNAAFGALGVGVTTEVLWIAAYPNVSCGGFPYNWGHAYAVEIGPFTLWTFSLDL